MIDITDKSYQPNMDEMDEFIGNPLFKELTSYLESRYKALRETCYSGDKVLLGWNIKFYKSGKTLCRLYPQKGYFSVLVVVGRKEKERAERLLPQMSKEMQAIYTGTQEGMGQRWLIMDLKAHDALYEDLLQLIGIRKG